MLTWMIACTLVSAVIFLTALILEWGLKARQLPTRAVWAVALILTLSWPFIEVIFAYQRMMAGLNPSVGTSGPLPDVVPPLLTQISESTASAGAVLDPLLPKGIAIVSLLLAIRLLVGIGRLTDLRFRGRRAVVDEVDVLITPKHGPGVFGFIRPIIALPEWCLELTEELRAMILRHEREHIRTGDQRLLWIGAIVTTLLPWNLFVWLMHRRHRLAIEMDCDRRTLAAGYPVDVYGKLLLLVSQHGGGIEMCPMLADAASPLSARVKAMLSPESAQPFWRLATGLTCLVPGLALAVMIPITKPVITSTFTWDGVRYEGVPPMGATSTSMSGSYELKPASVSVEQAGDLDYPTGMDGSYTGEVVVRAAINSLGRTTSTSIVSSTDPRLNAVVESAVRTGKYKSSRGPFPATTDITYKLQVTHEGPDMSKYKKIP